MTRRLLVVGDESPALDAVRTALEDGPDPAEVEHLASLEAADGDEPHLAIVAIHGLRDELAVAQIAKAVLRWPEAEVLALTDSSEPTLVRSVLDAGARTVLMCETPREDVRAAVDAAFEGRGLIDVDVVRPTIDLYATLLAESRRRDRAVIESLAAAVEAKDSVTSRHLRRVSRMATQLAEVIDRDISRREDFQFGCLLHDVGKIGVPEDILTKPGPLTADEWRVMRRHPQTGARVVRPLGLSGVVEDVVLCHHERWDGTGYPKGLRGTEIPLVARIFAVCDALEAMTAARPYRGPLPPQVAFERVRVEAGRQFDPDIIAALERGVADGAIDLEEPSAPEVVPARGRRFARAGGW